MGKLDGPTVGEVTRREQNMERRHHTREQNLDLAIKSVFDSLQGRMVLHHILSFCNIYSDCFTGNSRTFYSEGQRSIGLRIIEMIGTDTYIKLLKENKDV